MSSLRGGIQAGDGRVPLFLACSAVLAWFTWDACSGDEKCCKLFSDTLPKIAFLPAAFSVTAYNLRTRLLDLVLKIEAPPRKMSDYCDTSRKCGKRLTNLVLLFLVVAALMATSGFISEKSAWAPVFHSITMALFAGSIVNFIYIIFAFERLERFMLDDAERRSAEREAKRILDNKPLPEGDSDLQRITALLKEIRDKLTEK